MRLKPNLCPRFLNCSSPVSSLNILEFSTHSQLTDSLGFHHFHKVLRSKSLFVLSIMSMNGSIRTCAKLVRASEASLSKSGTRGFHSTGVKRMGGHGHDEPYYLHAKHMYNLDRMSHQKLKVTLGVFTAVSIGVAVPIWAVHFQQKKTASG
ncbi:PREDICTED: SLL1 [Prunus dulcis]|uniref:PREDICTED: SLL1 n=2 Tax=Prunus dulcis TaxID=3755 RepID=A0A5E4ECV9_PRUDU|nr:PREDICTED: SLL1 [Prunus dulcis]